MPDDYGKLEHTRQKEKIFLKAYFRSRNQVTGCQELGMGKWFPLQRGKRG